MLRASALAERNGVPTVTIIATGFLRQAAGVIRGLGLPQMAIAEYPGVPMVDADADFVRKVEEFVYPKIVEGLTRTVAPLAPVADAPLSYDQTDIVFRGTLDEVNDHFYKHHWSDGLPIVPPTLERVRQFLRFTDRKGEEVLGSLATAHRKATVWNVAVNGVMAGCRPEYMPILLAVVEILTDPRFKVEDVGSTPGWESMIIVNGSIAKQLHINSGQGVMRVGKIANTSIGRFLRLYLRNIAGFHHAPEGADKGSIGQSFLVAAAENEDAVAELGWQPFSVDRGFAKGENVVTVQSVVAISAPTYTGSEKASEHARLLADVCGERACGYWAAIGMVYSNWHPLIMLGPSIARVFAHDGWSKGDLRRYLYENVKVKASLAEAYAWNTGLTNFRIDSHVKSGLLPAEYAASNDPDRLVPVFPNPETIGIMIAGDWGRNQSKCYVNNHVQGPPITRRVALPKGWDALYAASKSAQEPQEDGGSRGLMAEVK